MKTGQAIVYVRVPSTLKSERWWHFPGSAD